MKKRTKILTSVVMLLATVLFFVQPVQATVADYYDPGYIRINGVFVNNWGQPIPGAVKRGMDVSMYQGDINWSLVAQDDIQFVFLRAGSFKSGMDPYFKKNLAGAASVGIPVGIYVKSYAPNEEYARLEAQFAVSCALQGYPVTYPIVIDMEGKELAALGSDQLVRNVNAFCQVVQSYGFKPMVYASRNWFVDYLPGIKWDKWVAQYKDYNDYTNNRKFWQCTSHGHVNGVEGRVDIDFQY